MYVYMPNKNITVTSDLRYAIKILNDLGKRLGISSERGKNTFCVKSSYHSITLILDLEKSPNHF